MERRSTKNPKKEGARHGLGEFKQGAGFLNKLKHDLKNLDNFRRMIASMRGEEALLSFSQYGRNGIGYLIMNSPTDTFVLFLQKTLSQKESIGIIEHVLGEMGENEIIAFQEKIKVVGENNVDGLEPLREILEKRLAFLKGPELDVKGPDFDFESLSKKTAQKPEGTPTPPLNL